MPDARPSSVAGGAHYHTLRATEKWKAFREAMQADVKFSAEHRARVDERRADAEAHNHPPT